jgi:hypothetical protein
MFYIRFAIPVLLGLGVGAFAQSPAVPPQLRTPARNPDAEVYRQQQISRAVEDEGIRLMRDGERAARESARFPSEARVQLSAADRRRIAEMLKPAAADVNANREFLKAKHTGIFMIYPDADCESGHQIRVDGPCAQHVIGGSGHSFRGGHSSVDVTLNFDELHVGGFFSQGMITTLGDVALDTIQASTVSVTDLTAVEAPVTLADAGRLNRQVKSGFGLVANEYSDSAIPKADTTYLARIIAYRAENIAAARQRFRDPLVPKFMALENDKRADVVVAFRVIRYDMDTGGLTILWKELSRRPAPKLKFGKNEKLRDIR